MENLTTWELETLQDAVRVFGEGKQIIKAIEELGELTQALCKFQAEWSADDAVALYDHVAEEMADVYIMLEQLKIIYANHDWVNAWAREKLARLRARVDQHGEAAK